MPTELVLFKEKQGLHALALVVIIVLGIGLPVYIAIQQLWVGKPFGNHPASNPVVAVLVPFIVLVALVLTGLNLDTRLYRDRLRVRLFPVADETFPLTRILRWEIRNYSVTIFKEFIGWGLVSGLIALCIRR